MGMFADRPDARARTLRETHAAGAALSEAARDKPGTTARGIVGDVAKLRVAELLIAGNTIREIAAELRIDRSQASALSRDPLVVAEIQAAFAARRNALARTLDAATFEAVALLRAVLNGPENTTKERIKAATEILDRGGVPRGVKLDIHNADTGTAITIDDVTQLTDTELAEVARLALERRGRIDVTP